MTEASVEIVITCHVCEAKQPPLVFSHPKLKAWVMGNKIQEVLPELSAEQRELLISGTCGACFDRMFA
jgi:hypothetical protein